MDDLHSASQHSTTHTPTHTPTHSSTTQEEKVDALQAASEDAGDALARLIKENWDEVFEEGRWVGG